MAMPRVTVFASSTPNTSPNLISVSTEFGRLLAERGCVGVFGGGNAGCMGAFAEAMHSAGGRIHGITHRMFIKPGGSSFSEENASALQSLEIVEGRDLTMRKRRLLDACDCIVALPGGVGTFDELWMAIAELGVHCGDRPVCLLNVDGYYDGSIEQLKRADKDGLLRKPWSAYVKVVETAQAAVEWCAEQESRATPTSPPTGSPYRSGVVHGVLLGAGATLALLAAARGLRA